MLNQISYEYKRCLTYINAFVIWVSILILIISWVVCDIMNDPKIGNITVLTFIQIFVAMLVAALQWYEYSNHLYLNPNMEDNLLLEEQLIFISLEFRRYRQWRESWGLPKKCLRKFPIHMGYLDEINKLSHLMNVSISLDSEITSTKSSFLPSWEDNLISISITDTNSIKIKDKTTNKTYYIQVPRTPTPSHTASYLNMQCLIIQP